jgi:hypothetical protein
VSISADLYPRWPPLLKIEISSNDQNCSIWLKIEQFWPFEEISIFSHDGHLGYRTALMDTILKENCSILSQKVPKFVLYKHNDEFFNIYYGILYEL